MQHLPYNLEGKTPAQLTLGIDMLLPIHFNVDWAVIEQN
jgi:hypothetical protein